MAAPTDWYHVLLLGFDPDLATTLRLVFAEDEERACVVTDLASSADGLRFIGHSDAPVVVLLGLDVPLGDPRFFAVVGHSLEPARHARHVIVGLSTNPERLNPAVRQHIAEWRIPVLAMPFDVDDLLRTVHSLRERVLDA
jgi:hypothetical protein